MNKTRETGTTFEDARRGLPSVAELLDAPSVHLLLEEYPRPLVLDAIRAALDEIRVADAHSKTIPSQDQIVERVRLLLRDGDRERLRPVVNATGIILHTGLGRAVLPTRAAKALATLDHCCNLQIDLETGQRGKRNYMCERLLCRLTGAEAAMLVNNNAAATLLMLAALCKDQEVIVSRGQLIEIGGSFRLPDCVHQSGARLVEVGTTNKTHPRDYESAITANTGALLRVNPSNYRVVGFSKSVSIDELVGLKARHDVLVFDDLGCGALVDLRQFGLPHEPTVPESIAAGADLVCFSGDKLIGGPQAGIIIGRTHLIDRIRKHPLTRMLRIGKLCDLALEQTLRLFLEPERLPQTHPVYAMLTASIEALEARAQTMQSELSAHAHALTVAVERGESETGGGALPATPIPTFVLAVTASGLSPQNVAARLRQWSPPVIARVKNYCVMIDVRTLLEDEIETVVDALASLSPTSESGRDRRDGR